MRPAWFVLPWLLTSAPVFAQPEPGGNAAPSSPAVPSTSPGTAAAPEAPGPYFVHASFGFNVWTHVGASGALPSADITPGDTAGKKKVILFQQLGFGYWVHPNVRVQLTAMFGETLTGRKPTESAFTLAAAIPCLMYTNGGFFGGAGPMIGPRAFGTTDVHVGLFTAAGYGIKLGEGFALSAAVQVPFMFVQRSSVAVTPALVLGKRF